MARSLADGQKRGARAMDCIQQLLGSDEGGKLKIEKFVVAGGSKRGWTTWCTAAVDKRVAAIVPSSIDCLNNAISMRHHVAVYGFYTEAVGDYYRHKIVQQSLNPRMKLLHAIEDPDSYRDRLTMPKYIVNASGDQYFAPDSSQFYFDGLPGEKYLRYVPNVAHNLKGSDARESVAAFYYSVVTGTRRPKYAWTFEKDGSIRVTTSEMTPKAVTLWQAYNPAARDFRLMTIGKAYKPQPLTDQGGGVYVAKITKPAHGWTASFVELTYDVGDSLPVPSLDRRPHHARYASARGRRSDQGASTSGNCDAAIHCGAALKGNRSTGVCHASLLQESVVSGHNRHLANRDCP